MTEERKFHFASETAIGFIEGDFFMTINGNDLEGTFDMGDAKIRLNEGYYEDGNFSGKFSEVILLTPVDGTIEGQIEGDSCALKMTTGFGTRELRSV